jgi:hypothetical protein
LPIPRWCSWQEVHKTMEEHVPARVTDFAFGS